MQQGRGRGRLCPLWRRLPVPSSRRPGGHLAHPGGRGGTPGPPLDGRHAPDTPHPAAPSRISFCRGHWSTATFLNPVAKREQHTQASSSGRTEAWPWQSRTRTTSHLVSRAGSPGPGPGWTAQSRGTRSPAPRLPPSAKDGSPGSVLTAWRLTSADPYTRPHGQPGRPS